MSKFNKEKILKQPQKRFIQLEKAQVGEDTLDFSFSSELPVERWYGKEILLNTPEAVDLSRCRQVLGPGRDDGRGDQVRRSHAP